jgi:hypothetical protein
MNILSVKLEDLNNPNMYLKISSTSEAERALNFNGEEKKESVIYIHSFISKRTGVRILQHANKSYTGWQVYNAVIKVIEQKFYPIDYETNISNLKDINAIIIYPTHLSANNRLPEPVMGTLINPNTCCNLNTSSKKWRVERLLKCKSKKNIFNHKLSEDLVDYIINCLFKIELEYHTHHSEYFGDVRV